MNRKWLSRDALGAALIFLTTLSVFWVSPVHKAFDSKYLMLFSQQLLWHQSFSLESQTFPELASRAPGTVLRHGEGLPYHLVQVGERFYSLFPPGSSVLSVPYIALATAMGISAVDKNGNYDEAGEIRIQAGLAALLMAGLAVILFQSSRLLLPLGWSLLIAWAAAFGTQIWSTASRVMWVQTWGVFILGFVIWLLLRAEVKQIRPPPVLLATCLSWLYFVRPTFCSTIVAVTAYVLLYHRAIVTPFLLAGSAWLAIFIGYSQHHFGRMLPPYYRASRLTFDDFWEAFAGNLISPSRGLLVYVPVLVFVGYLLFRYRSRLFMPRLIGLALSVVVVHLVIVAGFVPWTGGHCYGPRITTDLVPWFALLGILAVHARLSRRSEEPATDTVFRWRTEWACGALLLLLSVTLNGRGATSFNAWWWNVLPVDVDKNPARIWDWTHPQFVGVEPPSVAPDPAAAR